jgi:hypothetical protein
LPNKDETVVDEFYVYAFFDPCGDKPFYIGKGHSDRIAQHFRPSALKRSRPFYRKLRKMLAQGVQPLVVRLAQSIGESEALVLESFLILALGRRNDPLNPGPLWNLTNGGEGASGYVCSEETRLKISIGKRGTKLTEATKQTIAEQHRGMKATEETRQRMGNSRRGRPHAPAWCNAVTVGKSLRYFRTVIPSLDTLETEMANWLNSAEVDHEMHGTVCRAAD